MSDVKENPDPGEEDDEARAAIGEERQWDAGQRRRPHQVDVAQLEPEERVDRERVNS